MSQQMFEFQLYRINRVDYPDLFAKNQRFVEGDADIIRIVEHATSAEFEHKVSGPKNVFQWAVREFCRYMNPRRPRTKVFGITLARSVVGTVGEIVLDNSITEGFSESTPPTALTCRIFLIMPRHLLLVEKRSVITSSERWRLSLEEILMLAAESLGYTGSVVFSPMPRHEEILEAFTSFDRLTRLRVTLRLPNPEFSAYSKQLYDEMTEAEIEEFLQDMKNPRGLSKKKGKMPHAAAEISQSGYQKGGVRLEGMRQGKFDKIDTGKKAATGGIPYTRECVRSFQDAPDSIQAQEGISDLIDESDRIAPPASKEHG